MKTEYVSDDGLFRADNKGDVERYERMKMPFNPLPWKAKHWSNNDTCQILDANGGVVLFNTQGERHRLVRLIELLPRAAELLQEATYSEADPDAAIEWLAMYRERAVDGNP